MNSRTPKESRNSSHPNDAPTRGSAGRRREKQAQSLSNSGPRADQRKTMEYLPSISRSGGVEKDGDALKDVKTQDKYWTFIEQKLNQYWAQFPLGSQGNTQKSEMESGNILILLRKLREGIISSRRNDELAFLVYEASLYMAIIFHSPAQATSTISHLFGLYAGQDSSTDSTLVERLSKTTSITSIVSLLHHLNEAYPSQSAYFTHLASLPSACASRGSTHYEWLSSIQSSLLFRNYSKFEKLTSPPVLATRFSSGRPEDEVHLEKEAVCTLIEALRIKMRRSAWAIIRTAYRELSQQSDANDSSWLGRTLMLQTVSNSGLGEDMTVADWMVKRGEEGHVQVKEGNEMRWIVYKPK